MSQQLERFAGMDAEALRQTLEQLVRTVGALLDVPAASVALLEPETGDLVTWAALGASAGGPPRTRFRPNEGVAGWVAAHLEPAIIPDVTLDARYKPLGPTRVRSMLCVPLIDQDQLLLGTLTVASPEYGAFDGRRQQFLQVFSDQAVLAISKTRQAEAAKAQARELTALLDASRALTSSLDPSQVFAYIVASTRKVIVCDDVVIYAYEDHSDSLRVVTGLGPRIERLGGAEVPLEDAHSIAAWVARHRRARISTPGRSSEIGAVTEAFLAGDVLAILCVPLVSKGRLRGVIMLARDQEFLPGELGAMLNLSNIVAATLENAELYQAARAEREQQAAIYAAASDAIAVVDSALTLVEVNDAFARLAGQPRDRILGMRYCDALRIHDISPGELCASERTLAEALRTGEPEPLMECELELAQSALTSGGLPNTRTAPRHFVDFSVTPVNSPQGRRLLLVGRDVTAAREMDQMKANFLSMVSHELRSPLQTINGYLDLSISGMGGALSPQHNEFVRRARAGSEHLTALVDDLLLVSRQDAGQFALNLQDKDITRIIVETAEETEILAEDVDVTLHLEVPTSLPPVRADGPRLAQVFRNLLTNAIKFTPPGGTVTISAERATSRVLVRVRDTGVGIAPEHQDKIFDRFFQVGNASPHERARGQGLGLAIVRIIVESHGGTIQVQSAPGEGSTFTVSLPLAPTSSLPGASDD